MIKISGSGGKSGAGGGGISEDPDTLSGVTRARYIDLIGEGPIKGLVNGEASIYLDGVPLRDLKGTPNYKPFKWTSTTGTSDQLPIPGFSGTSSEVGVGVNLTVSAGTIIRSISDGDADAVRVNVSVTGLSLTNSAGKISATTVAYIIRARRSGGTWVDLKTVTITGKTGARYPKSDEVLLTGFSGTGAFEVSVTRTTPDSASALLVNGLHWDSFTVINYEQYAYPHSALLALELDARYFSQIPARSYHLRGLLVRVPDNYDPLTRVYTGVWRGRGFWKLAYTNNPAWCYFDLITNRRYGLGRRISDDQVDVWGIYTLGKYCDEIVPTGGTSNISDIIGTGGVSSDGTVVIGAPIRGSSGESRFTLNCVINTVDDAYRVLNQLSTAFRGMTYWGASGVAFTQDRPTPVSMLWNNANVLDGKFAYAGSSKANRHTAVSVAWNDPGEDFRQRFEYVEDRDGITRYGVRSTEVTAFGCTSRSQARRVGLWMLYTERMETDVITFRAGLDSSQVRPGDTGEILDSKRVGLRWGGRISASTLTSITLDASVTLALGTYTLAIVAKDGTIVSRSVVISTAGVYATLTLTIALAAVPADMAMWVLSSTAVSPVTVRVINVRQTDAATYEFAVLRHNPGKYNAIDLGAKLAVPSYTALKRVEQPAVTGLVAVENTYRLVTATAARSYLEVSWDHGVVGLVGGVSVLTKDLLTRGYNLVITKAGETPFTILEQSDSTYTYADIAPGTYTVTVRPVSYLGVVGANEASVTQVVTGVDTVPPENVQGLTCTILTGGPRFAWTRPVDLSYRQTEIHIETVWNDATAPLFVGDANDYTWNWPTAGSYRAVVKHRDTAGNMSVTAASVDFTIGANIKVDFSTAVGGASKPADNATIGTALNADPYMLNSAAWAPFDGSVLSFATVADGKVGVGVARSPAAGTASWGNGVQRLAVDHAKTYRLSGWLRTVSGSGSTAYLGTAVFDSAGANIAGDGSQWYYAASADPSTSWTRYSGLFGFGTAKTFPANARTMAPLFILSIGGFTSIQEVQDLRIEEVTEVLAAATTATWAGIPSGTGKADDYATRNVIYRQIGDPVSSPGSVVNGATWLELDSGGTVVINTYHRVGGAWVLGPTGPTGASVYTATVYKQTGSAPAAPSGGSFNFSTSTLTAPSGWSITQPATTTTPTYACEYTFGTTTPATSVTAGTWTTPYIDAVAGTAGGTGADGESVLVLEVYLQAASAPSAPSGGTYTFSTDSFTAPAGGWSRSMPTSSTTPTWRAAYRFATNTPAVAVTAGSYSAPVAVAQNGADGSTGPTGYSSALVTIYKRSATLPTVPTATATYTFASGISGLSNGWSATPQAGTDPQYVTVATASATGASDTIATGEWAGPVIQVQDGTSGTSGLNSATVYLFQRTATSTAPALPSSPITYTFASALATGITNGWAQSLPTTGGAYRWVTTASALSASATDTIAAGEWAAAALLSQDGTDGASAPVLSLSRTTVNFAADSTGLIDAGQSFTSTVLVMLGAADDTANWSLSAATSDGSISGTLSGAVVTLNAMGTSVDAGTVTITATKAGYANQVAVISVGKIKRAVAATGPVASLGNLFAENYTISPSDASATVQFRRDGTVWTVDDSGTVQVGSWYLPNGTAVGDNFQVRFDQISSAADGASSANGAWSTLTALRSVSLINTVNSNSFKTAAVAYSVRPLAGGSTVISGTIQLTASVEI